MSKVYVMEEREPGLYFKDDMSNARISVGRAVQCQSGKNRDILARLIAILHNTNVHYPNDTIKPVLTGEDLATILPDFVWDDGPDEDEDEY